MPVKVREVFERAKILERAEAGDLRVEIIANNHPSRPKANEPFCTRSQMLSYRDKLGREVARAHRYLRPDGSIGLSGKPDPKRVLYNLELYISLLE